jgi:hypothetical protein
LVPTVAMRPIFRPHNRKTVLETVGLLEKRRF